MSLPLLLQKAKARIPLLLALHSTSRESHKRPIKPRPGAMNSPCAWRHIARAYVGARPTPRSLSSPATQPSDFSFTIAIGRSAESREKSNGRMEIDVSAPPAPRTGSTPAQQPERTETYGSYPVASLEERRFAAAIDFACLLFAYGGFLALFASLGGQFTLSKLSAAVYGVTFAIVYLQYFALFTVFGGTTPGMMFRGMQVTSFTGDSPTPRQMLLRSAGYILSAGTFFLGFFWAWG